MTSSTRFSVDILHSYDRLQHFLNGREAIQQIKQQRYRPFPVVEPIKNSALWAYVPDLFIKIYAAFVKTIGYLVFTFASYELGAKLIIHSRHSNLEDLSSSADVSKALSQFRKRVLVRTYNLPQKEAIDLLAQPFIEGSTIPDKRVKKMLNEEKDIFFVSETGICYGSCEWFAYLYFKTKHLFQGPEKNLIAIANLFKKGAPREAIVLQNFQKNLNESPILGTAKRVVHEIPNKGTSIEKARSLVKALFAASPGFYNLETATHAQVWIKIDNTASYLFDPNIGLVKCKTKRDHLFMSAIIAILYNRENPVLLKLKRVSERYFPKTPAAA